MSTGGRVDCLPPASPEWVPARETAGFIGAGLEDGAAILEVGCGAGRVAVALASRGFRVIALDSDRRALMLARERGAAAVQACWPRFRCVPVDVVAFTRSLHHIHPLGHAVAQARTLLAPGGLLKVEDFAYEEADEVTLGWFTGILASPAARSLMVPAPGEFATDLLEAADPLPFWHENHGAGLHAMAAMRSAIGACFDVAEPVAVPYLYRYLVPVLQTTPEAAAFLDDVLREEARRGTAGEIVLVGRRLTASPRPA